MSSTLKKENKDLCIDELQTTKFDEEIITSNVYSDLPKLVISTTPNENKLTTTTDTKENEGLSTLSAHRRSCDSAYGSSMESNLAITPEESSAYETSSKEASSDERSIKTVELSPKTKPPLPKKFMLLNPSENTSSKSSCCSSPAEPDDSRCDVTRVSPLKGSTKLDRQAFFRKLSSTSKYSLRSSLSIESEDDLTLSDELKSSAGIKQSPSKVPQRASSWTKLRRMVIWSPFMQSFKKNYPWVQLAGHTGNFQAGEEGCILKKYVECEANFLQTVTNDSLLNGLAPTFEGVVTSKGDKYTRMQDLLLNFDQPSIMDCKMGVRTYLEEELAKAKINPKLRPDMYKKMVEISPDAPTEAEHKQKAVTKPRYMQWRELVSSTSNLGFRIEGIKKGNKEPSKDYKLTKSRTQVIDAFNYFIEKNLKVIEKYLDRLQEIKEKLQTSNTFARHEVIGSSLLFVHNQDKEEITANVWMIDFGKTHKLPHDATNDHYKKWVEGNREDGYLMGLDNMMCIFEEVRKNLIIENLKAS